MKVYDDNVQFILVLRFLKLDKLVINYNSLR